MDEWRWMSAAELGRGIGAGGIDPVELTEVFLDAIDTHEHRDRIFARLTPDRARAEAGAAAQRARTGTRKSPLDGVPVSWKDLFDTAGTATEAGSALLEGRIPDRDARVLARASAFGLVCLGKTHLSEFAFSGIGINPKTATPPNRHNPAWVPGGSSSGAAASVAYGLAAAGIGSDTGGSVRIPAAWNDLVGLKTTSGRLPLDGVVPLCPSFDTVGPLCRTVEDASLLLAIMERGTPPDLRNASVVGLRFGALQTAVLEGIRDEPREAYEAAIGRLRDAGATVEPLEAPEAAEALAQSGVYAAEAYGIWKDTIEVTPQKMFAEILGRFRSGAQMTAPDFVASWEILHRARRSWAERVAGFDAVIAPTAPNLPPDAARMLSDHDYYVTENLLTLRNTRVGNVLGLSSLTLPTGAPACGIMFLGRPMGEEALLRIGAAAEKALS
ncbi:amidase family protein [Pseudooceanicola batsensis HTCC2597]|uniref:Amidase family protein n=1 Tax=Pseudooceanicola batsensis (strain ATCC BAA-863 / DSM 15984 / KCTC 12145 / HTCC2597) TaxID=252305 RepID=A3TWH3_PSEBH|nr:amidase family protein [Pseudooceanicola batsensis]EAQ03969.1 amidase family protein [Pseudooceanicola batsensis HTCC2597]